MLDGVIWEWTSAIWYCVVEFGAIWCHMVEHGTIWLDVVPYGWVRCYMVRCDVVEMWVTIPSKARGVQDCNKTPVWTKHSV
jgi:hypothetical protein